MIRKMMVVFLGIVMHLLVTGQNKDDILMKVGGTDVTVGEFKYIYEKNNGAQADYSQKSLEEYLDLYTRFKLKVAKARQVKLDTISSLMSELDGYRKQLASSYLIDKEVTDFLLRELYDRMKTDVDFSHIFIPAAENASRSVKEDAKNKLRDVKSRIVGGMTFEEAAREFSQDRTTSTRGGHMGFFTAKLPSGFYELETALYNTPLGQVSDIVESKIGYHLVRVNNKRPARGTMEVAHILVKSDRKQMADSLANLLRKTGADFDELALKFSEDKTSSKNGGKLPPFGINTYDHNFEDAAFGLQNNGDISEPVLTKSGWHIIKRIAKPEPDTYDVFVRRMKAQINKDQRFDAAKIKLINDIKKSAGFREERSELQKFTATLNEDFYSYKWTPDSSLSAAPLFSLAGSQKYNIRDFAGFCKKNTRTRLKYDKSKPLAEIVDELYNEYVNEIALAYEESSLEKKYPDFKSLMREYEEGILLFEATRINVWDKANQDTVGLQKYFEQHKKNYFWPEKATGSEFRISGTDQKTAEKIYSYGKKNDGAKILSKFNKKSKVVEEVAFEYEKGSADLAGIDWKVRSVSPLVQQKSGNAWAFKKLSSIVPVREKNLSEARGYVVADYQDYLEKQWIEQLSREFEVVINKDVLMKLKRK